MAVRGELGYEKRSSGARLGASELLLCMRLSVKGRNIPRTGNMFFCSSV